MYRNFGEMPASEGFRQERAKHPSERLLGLMRDISSKLNAEVESNYGIRDLLDDECKINLDAYTEIYGQEEIDKSKEAVRERELEFSDAEDSRVKEFYQKEHGFSDEESIISQWKKEKSRNKNSQMELAVTALLYKMLGDRYIVARASDYDDYKNGIDNLIVDKQTGAVLCAFDEVHQGGKANEQIDKKHNKIMKIAADGGAEVNFGLKLSNGQLQRAKLENLPVFYLALHTQELQSLIEKMDSDLSGEPNEIETSLYNTLIESVKSQYQILIKKNNLPNSVKQNLMSFGQSLDTL